MHRLGMVAKPLSAYEETRGRLLANCTARLTCNTPFIVSSLYQLRYTSRNGLSCPTSIEALAILQSQQSLEMINTECGGNKTQLMRNIFKASLVTKVKIVCDSSRSVKTLRRAVEAINVLQRKLTDSPTSCECLEQAAASWSLGLIFADQFSFKCDQSRKWEAATGMDVTTALCTKDSKDLPCIMGREWRFEVYWESSDNLDLVIFTPSQTDDENVCFNVVGTKTRTCKGTVSPLTGGSWELKMGPDVKDGRNGYENATLIVNSGPPMEQKFSVSVWKETPPFNVTATVKYFFDGVEVISVVPNIASAGNNNAWLGLNINILDLTVEADPNKFVFYNL
eukprot:m.165648 g.165648  ORF g.165648 m.165648 type:complete len:338 (+) comp38895_c1_seq15:1060-2073(+)